MQLRPYQQTAVDRTLEDFESYGSTLNVLPTGCGKTVIAAHVVDHMMQRGRVMFLAHREELLTQAADKFERVSGIRPAVEMADMRSDERGWFQQPIVVSSIQSQISPKRNGRRFQKFNPSDFSLVIVDEAHRSAAASYKTTLDWYRNNPNLKVMGLTATPDRHDEKALGQVFENVAFEYSILDAIDDGWLVPVDQQAVYIDELDLSYLRSSKGDFLPSDLAHEMEKEKAAYAVGAALLEHARGIKTLVFTASVKHAELVTDYLNGKHANAAIVTGETPRDERHYVINSFRTGRIQYLVNVGVATEGFDVPDIQCVAVARPTKSRALYAQMLGRGTRPLDRLLDRYHEADGGTRCDVIASSGKPSVLILDFVGNSGKHKLVSPIDILGGDYDDEVAELASSAIRESGGRENVRDVLAKCKEEERVRREVEAAKRARVRVNGRFQTVKVDPFDLMGISVGREPGYYTGKEPTPKQVEWLEKFGIPNVDQLSRHKASKLLDALFDKTRPTFKQTKYLRQFGYDGTYTRDEAKQILDREFGKRRGGGGGWKRVGT